MKLGDHIIVDDGTNERHAIYAGNGQVISYMAKLDGDACRFEGRLLSVNEFTGGQVAGLIDYPLRIWGRKQAVKRACSLLGKSIGLFAENGGHLFVAWCINGLPFELAIFHWFSIELEKVERKLNRKAYIEHNQGMR